MNNKRETVSKLLFNLGLDGLKEIIKKAESFRKKNGYINYNKLVDDYFFERDKGNMSGLLSYGIILQSTDTWFFRKARLFINKIKLINYGK